ncbi:16S rRNA (uracil(1498)-N(3))-methyltransferase [Actinomyces howellii]|uniref:Ribosomal RNA small subunit methyltransferase E n=1 Tax=Actinomyces howellii TaxID=52771 RepID=A0A448HES3_9ACTO|nr:16S rRNA (uracil(1498)-N(3))-methyltransferase [Actinomyces howellii]VEG26583.1 Ribosomal RNA small subunit methyltransferase E [Actinomyces howellii]
MTAPVFVMTPQTLEPAGAVALAGVGDLLTLGGPEGRHAVSVRRLRAGERVDLVDGDGLRLVCEVLDAVAQGRKDRLAVRVVERLVEPAESLTLALVQALAKGDRDSQAVETATEVGAGLVLPWQAERCVSVWKGPKAAKGRDRWQATALQAAKQARRARVPRVAEPMGTPALADWTREVRLCGGLVLVLHEESDRPIGDVPLPEPDRSGEGRAPVLAVVVGPEGGISEAETALLEAAGAVTVRLGPHVMRTSSAGPVALAVLAQRAGLWGQGAS